MYPHERSLVKNLAGKKFALIGINSDSDPAIPQRLSEEGVVNWRSFWNGPEGPPGPIATAFKVRGWPTIILVDAKGVVRYMNKRGDELDEAIAELMKENGEEFPLDAVHQDMNKG